LSAGCRRPSILSNQIDSHAKITEKSRREALAEKPRFFRNLLKLTEQTGRIVVFVR
jgi:hypothetical protein